MGDRDRVEAPAPSFEEGLGKAAFEALGPWFEALPKDRVEQVRLALDGAAVQGLSLARKIAAPEVAELLGLLPARLWDPGPAERLKEVSWATWYVHVEASRQRVKKNQRKVSLDVAQAASEVRKRMLELTSYQLGDHAVAGPEVASIRKGVGYLDTAMDLSRLADLYRHPDYAGLIQSDSKHYRPTDEAEARRLAAAILSDLGEGQTEHWARLEAIAWTRLNADYNEVCRALRFIYANDDPHGLRDTPTLFQALRSPAST